MIWIIIILLVIVLDQISKAIITSNMTLGQDIIIIEKFFYLTYWENSGAAWGVFQNGTYFFIPLNLILTGVLVYLLAKCSSSYLKIALSLIIGGALGNVIDRIFRSGHVVDFLNFYIFGYDFPIFNIADSFIVVGTIVLSYYVIFKYKESDKIFM